MSLFGVAGDASATEVSEILLPDIEEWDEREKLMYEKETVGFYITGHPLENALAEMQNHRGLQISST